jgi:DNA-binding NtrC family response regulator
MTPVTSPDPASLSDLARSVFDLSVSKWGDARAVVLIGRDAALAHAQCRMLQFAQADSPVLITGETGPESVARALCLLSARRGVRCLHQLRAVPDSQLLVELSDTRGARSPAPSPIAAAFEEADLAP